MAVLEFAQEPVNSSDNVPVITNWTPLIGYMLERTTSIAALFYYKLVLEVRLDDASGTLLAKIKQRRNGYSVDVDDDKARAFFDLRDIVNSNLVDTVFDQNDAGQPFRTIHKIGANTTTKPFSVNGDNTTDATQIQTIYVKGYENYSSTASGVPSDETGNAINDTLYYMSASLPLMTTRNSSASYIQSNAFNVFAGNSVTDRFLSDVETSSGEYNISGYINYIRWNDTTDVGDYHTVGFLNDYTNFTSDLKYMRVRYYNASGVQLSSTLVTNSNANGGATPQTESNTDAESLIYYGCGTANLEAQTVSGDGNVKPSAVANAGWAYYTIEGGLTALGYNGTAIYYFIRQDGSCKGFKVRRLAWRNSLGCYDYYNFKMKSTQTIEVERDNYNSMLGTFNKSKWRYNNTQRGKTTRQTTAILKETLNTGWITEQDGNLLEKLIYSTNVEIVENEDTEFTQGVIITDTSFVKKTVANDKLMQYTINIEYANPINTNS